MHRDRVADRPGDTGGSSRVRRVTRTSFGPGRGSMGEGRGGHRPQGGWSGQIAEPPAPGCGGGGGRRADFADGGCLRKGTRQRSSGGWGRGPLWKPRGGRAHEISTGAWQGASGSSEGRGGSPPRATGGTELPLDRLTGGDSHRPRCSTESTPYPGACHPCLRRAQRSLSPHSENIAVQPQRRPLTATRAPKELNSLTVVSSSSRFLLCCSSQTHIPGQRSRIKLLQSRRGPSRNAKFRLIHFK